MHKYLVLLLFLLIVISGCVSSGTVGSGVVINKWQPDLNIIKSSDFVTLFLEIENTGSELAREVIPTIEGINANEWGLKEKYQSIELKPSIEDSNGAISGEKKIYMFKDLKPPIETGTLSYKPTIKVLYKYSSSVIKTINVQQSKEASRGQIVDIPTQSQSRSPISINVRTENPIRVSKTDIDSVLIIEFSNNGNGHVCSPDCSERKNKDKIKYKIEFSNPIISLSQNENPCKYEDTLPITGTNIISCKINVRPISNPMEQFLVTVTTEYEYQIVQETLITVDNTPKL